MVAMMLAVARADGSPSSRTIEALRSVVCGVWLDEAGWSKLALDEKLHSSDHYATLGLKPGASAEEIRRAYRSLISQYHPDHFANAPADIVAVAQRKSVELREAYDALRGVT
jgi:DnaJ-domain-containing protein 1